MLISVKEGEENNVQGVTPLNIKGHTRRSNPMRKESGFQTDFFFFFNLSPFFDNLFAKSRGGGGGGRVHGDTQIDHTVSDLSGL